MDDTFNVTNLRLLKVKKDNNELIKIASKYVDSYLDMGCFKNPELVRPALLEGFT